MENRRRDWAYKVFVQIVTCADPEEGGTGGPDPS